MLKSKLADVGTSIFSVMSGMAQEHNAINLSQGFPDFPVSEALIALVNKYMVNGFNQYAPMPGVPALREQIASMIYDRFKHHANPDTDITITSGATEALFNCISALVSAGDEVVIFDPAYDSYDPAIRLSGGIPVHLTLKQPDFSIDWEEVSATVSEQTKLIIINTPHNPSGAVLKASDMYELQQLLDQHPQLMVLSDEVYEHIIFDSLTHESILKYPGIASRAVAIYSFGKTFHATGWKIGYTVAPAHITSEIRKVHQFVTFSVNTAVQLAIAEYLQNADNYVSLPEFYQSKRDFFLAGIKNSRFEPIACHGTYFQLLSYANISSRPDTEMATWLTQAHKLASIPISAFYQDGQDDHILRFCFAKSEETLTKAAQILCAI